MSRQVRRNAIFPGAHVDRTVLIVGAGIAGLGAAYFAKKAGMSPIVLEASHNVGGRISTIVKNNIRYETGGKNFSSSWVIFNQILSEFYTGELDVQHSKFNFFARSHLYQFDKRLTWENIRSLVRCIGFDGAISLLGFIRSSRKARHLTYYERDILGSEAVAPYRNQQSAHQIDGKDVLLRLPSVVMAAAEPDEISFETLSLLISSLRNGRQHSLPGTIQQFIDHLRDGIDVRIDHRVERVLEQNGQIIGLAGQTSNSPFRYESSNVIVATPLHQIGRLCELPIDVRIAASAIPYYPLVLINADYDRDVFDEKITSIMFDRFSPLGHCSANRSYKLNSVRFTLSGRAARPLFAYDDETLLSVAEREFAKIRQLPGPAHTAHVRRHMDGLCAYGFSYRSSRECLINYMNHTRGIAFAGDFLYGHNMEGCLQSALAANHYLMGNKNAYYQMNTF